MAIHFFKKLPTGVKYTVISEVVLLTCNYLIQTYNSFYSYIYIYIHTYMHTYTHVHIDRYIVDHCAHI